jgi:transposase InsO family protein
LSRRCHITSTPILTDNGIQFADLPKNRGGLTARWRGHPFDRVCLRHSINHRLTKPNHPWTNGQVERMNRTIKDATVKRYHYDSRQMSNQLGDFNHDGVQLRQAPQDARRTHFLRIHLSTLDHRAGPI